jgi:formylglycine-generating enzyme required for sulfatase activity
MDEVAWSSRNSGKQTQPVGTKASNAWGIHDMSGNVHEWTGDRYDAYPTGSVTDPQGPPTGDRRVARGGSYNSSDALLASRSRSIPDRSGGSMGFRIVRNAE